MVIFRETVIQNYIVRFHGTAPMELSGYKYTLYTKNKKRYLPFASNNFKRGLMICHFKILFKSFPHFSLRLFIKNLFVLLKRFNLTTCNVNRIEVVKKFFPITTLIF